MNTKTFSRLIGLVIFTIFLFQGCDQESFVEDKEVEVLPSNLAYADIIGHQEFAYIETDVPTYNSNGHPVTFEVISIKKDDAILDASYLNSVTILNPETVEFENPTEGSNEMLTGNDLGNAGKIIIEDGNPFANGDYYFTIEASNANGSVTFEDVLHLQVGWASGITYCPFKVNLVNGASTISGPATVLGGRENYTFELGSDSDMLSIDPITGAISLNPDYTITDTEYISPIIKLIYSSNESVPLSFSGSITAILSTTPVELEQSIEYFFYPTLQPFDDNNPRFGGDGYTVETSDFESKPGWLQKHLYKKIVDAAVLNFDEALETRVDAGVSGITGSQFNYWGPLTNPFETWLIANPVNLAAYSGCFDTKVVFWVKQNIPQDTLDNLFAGETETPVNIEIKITDNYSGDVTTTTWSPINELLTCKIGEGGNEFTGTPYPLSGEVGAEGNANNLWVKCEMDLPASEYGDMDSFTIAFRTKTNYDTDLSDNLRGELYISDLHFVATEIQ